MKTTKKGKEEARAEKEDVFQAILFADNFGAPIFGSDNSPFQSESLISLANRNLIDYSLEALTVSGVQEIFIYCSKQIEAVRTYLSNSKWLEIPSVTINIISSEDAHSLGDALRDLDGKRVIRNDFILMQAGVITNLRLKPILERHRSIVGADKGALMTLVQRKMLPGHRSSCDERVGVVVDSKSDKIIAYNRLKGKRFMIPLESMKREMDIHLNYCDTGITICSGSVLPLFTDNFDFSSLDDFIREILINEEIMGNSIYLEKVNAGYANRVVDFKTYHGITCDILQRWAYPVSPERPFGPSSAETVYNMHFNYVYKGENIKMFKDAKLGKLVLIGNGTEIGQEANISSSTVGHGCRIGPKSQVLNSFLGNNVIIGDGVKITSCILTDGAKVKSGAEVKPFSLIVGEEATPIHEERLEEEEDEDDEYTDSEEELIQESIAMQDVDFQRFTTEVVESFYRGYLENIVIENLILEVNSSKFANNVTMKEVTTGVCKAIIMIPSKMDPNFTGTPLKAQWEKTRDVLDKFKDLLRHYSKTGESQTDLITALEEYANDNKEFRPLLMQVLHTLYNHDILGEEIILEWHKNPSLYDAAAELRVNVSKFITWLEEASESEEEEESEED